MGADRDPLCGILVGGAATRMGGAAKGLLLARDTGEPLVVRMARIVAELGYEVVLVGKADAYALVLPTLRVLADDPSGIGPLGGLNALLKAADHRPAITLACDMPRVSSALLRRLATAHASSMVLAPRSDNRMWQPLCARYEAASVRPLVAAALARGVRSFQQLFDTLDVRELTLNAEERAQLIDWDAPSDIER